VKCEIFATLHASYLTFYPRQGDPVKYLKFRLNPLLVKEFRSRMRGWRAFVILTVYLIFLGLFSYGVYRIILFSTYYTGGMPLSPFIGRALYAALANLSLFFVVFLTPALTATAISSEHEKLTLEMLQATPLAAHTILFGKLVSTAGYILLLLFAAVPMASLVFIFGGVAPVDLLLAALVIVSTAITFGIIGLFFSAWRKRTIQAIVLSYVVILILIGGTFALYIFWGMMARDFPSRSILLFNPFSALASVLAGNAYQGGPGFFSLLAGWSPVMSDPQLTDLRPLWHYTLAFYLILSTILYLLATRFIKPIRPWRINWRGVTLIALIAVLYISIGTTVFFKDINQILYPPPDLPTPTPVPFMGPVPIRAVPVQKIVVPVPTATPAADEAEETEEKTSDP
jgi:ABC-type transport system involved in multi-copper enzyme maturation permease subunit